MEEEPVPYLIEMRQFLLKVPLEYGSVSYYAWYKSTINMYTTFIQYAQLMRLHRPIGILLLLWPTLWALWIASYGNPSWELLSIFICGTLLMRSAGCIVNDLADQSFDGFVARTKNRPLVTALVSQKEAFSLFVILCLLAAALLLFLNALTRWLALIAVLLTIIYPFMKRYIYFPQCFLGVTFSFGIPMAFAAQNEYIPALAWFLFLINVIWIIAYDTIYAMADRSDDIKIGIKSTAILFGHWDTLVVSSLHGLMLLLLILLGFYLHLVWFYFLSIMAACGIIVYIQYLIHNRDPSDCLRAFSASQWVGGVVWAGLALSLA